MAELVRFQFSAADGAPEGDGEILTPGKPFRVFPGGLTRAIDGRRLDLGDAQLSALLSNFTDPVAVTWEHERTEKRAGEAAGWIKRLAAGSDGSLMAAEVDWTEDGLADLKADRYRYVSADAYGEWAEDVEGLIFRPLRLAAVTLTNKPAFRDMGRVTFEAEHGGNRTVQKEDIRMKKETFALIGVAENADSDAIHAGFEAKLVAAKDAGKAEATAEFEAKLAETKAAGEKAVSDAVAATKAEFEAAAAKAEQAAKTSALVEKGMREGKVTAATRDSFAEMAGASFEAAEKFLASAPRIAPISALFMEPKPEELAEGVDVDTPEGRAALAEKAAEYAAKNGKTFSEALAEVLKPAKS